MERTLIAVFDNRGNAQSALEALIAAGFSYQQASLSAADPTGAPDAGMADSDGSLMGSIKHFLSTMFGTDNSEHVQKYSDAVTRGHQVLTLHVAHERELGRASDIIERFGPVDIDQSSVQGATGTPDSGAVQRRASAQQQGASMSQQSMQGSAGSMQGLAAGAAESHFTSPSAPGAQQRATGAESGGSHRAAQRSGNGVPLAAHLAKPPQDVGVPTAADEAYFRIHCQRHYGASGEQYDDYAPAYQYGALMASDDHYRGRAWQQVALQLQDDWAGRYPGANWAQFEAAIRYGWEKRPS